MRKYLLTFIVLLSLRGKSQTGMDNAALTPLFFGNGFSHLHSTANNPNKWERALGVYQSPIAPTSYLEVNTNPTHLTQSAGFIPNLGEVFKTNSPVDASWRMFVQNNQLGSIYSTLGSDFNMESSNINLNQGNLIFKTAGANERMRILGNMPIAPLTGYSRTGFIGVNNPNPQFHFDMISPAFLGGELFFTAKPSDVPSSDLGFVNATAINSTFLPTVFGNLDGSQLGHAFQMLGNIDPSQDLINRVAVTRFISTAGWQYNQTIAGNIVNRDLFIWNNGSIGMMSMEANGRLRIGNNVNPNAHPFFGRARNRVEITAGPGDPYFSGYNLTSGASGLRLTECTSNSTPQIPNTNNGINPNLVLTVDRRGDVVLINSTSSNAVPIGNYCNPLPTNPNALINNFEIPLAGHDYNFSPSNVNATQNAASKVNVGYNICSPNAPGRFNSKTDIHRFAGTFINNNGFVAGFECVGVGGEATSTQADAIGVRGHVLAAPVNMKAIGVHGESLINSGASFNYGISGTASNGVIESAGGRFISENSNSPENYGIKALAKSGNTNANRDVGGMLSANVGNGGAQRSIGAVGSINLNNALNGGAGINSLPVGMTIGVYGYNPLSNSIHTSWAGFFQGDVNVVGTIWTNNFGWNSSDKRYKKDIKKLEYSLDKLKQLHSYTYYLKTEEFKDKNFDKAEQIGFIAQELKEVFPQLVKEDGEGYLAVNYQGMIPVLLEGIKEQQTQIESQQQQINELKAMVQSLASNMSNSTGSKAANSQAVTLSDKNVVVLNQNVPNPFAESTTITFNIPTDFVKAQIVFNTSEGKIIKSVDITEKGEGHLNVFANDLSNGMYSYSLIVDGKVIDTKKMVKQN